MTFDVFDVVVVPFPFTDKVSSRRRPAVALSTGSFGEASGHSVFAMITSARQSAWPLDVPVVDLESAGLGSACFVRMKLFTLDHRLVLRKTGRLGEPDMACVRTALGHLFLGR